MPIVTYAEAIRKATQEILFLHPNAYVLGLGATYPNGLDGTMGDLAVHFLDRVLDMPCSENALTGMAVGMAMQGLKPIVHHGRIEFALHAMDQIITQAAKWNYMFGGNYQCAPIFRIAMGRQWGNGPQHTLNHKALFAIPGLRVVCPATPHKAYNLLMEAVTSPFPTVFLESRWLYKVRQNNDDWNLFSTKYASYPLTVSYGPNRSNRQDVAASVTIIAIADAVLYAHLAGKLLESRGIEVDIVDAVCAYPINKHALVTAVESTKKVIVCDFSSPGYSFAHEVLGQLAKSFQLEGAMSITCPDTPCPTAPELTKDYYPDEYTIANAALMMLGLVKPDEEGGWFKRNKTFEETNLPPTVNFSEIFA